jgi:hypothetical protein
MSKQKCELCGEGKCTCEKEIRVFFCPKCKSMNVRYVFGVGNIFGIIPRMKCFDCNYTAPGFPLLVTSRRKLEESRNNLKTKKTKKQKKVRRKNG